MLNKQLRIFYITIFWNIDLVKRVKEKYLEIFLVKQEDIILLATDKGKTELHMNIWTQ